MNRRMERPRMVVPEGDPIATVSPIEVNGVTLGVT